MNCADLGKSFVHRIFLLMEKIYRNQRWPPRAVPQNWLRRFGSPASLFRIQRWLWLMKLNMFSPIFCASRIMIGKFLWLSNWARTAFKSPR